MKLYNVFRLYVIKKNNIKFICKKDNKSNAYIEIFTNEKIAAKNIDSIESLRMYYSVIEVTFYKNRKSKSELLLKYIEINDKAQNKVLIKK